MLLVQYTKEGIAYAKITGSFKVNLSRSRLLYTLLSIFVSVVSMYITYTPLRNIYVYRYIQKYETVCIKLSSYKFVYGEDITLAMEYTIST